MIVCMRILFYGQRLSKKFFSNHFKDLVNVALHADAQLASNVFDEMLAFDEHSQHADIWLAAKCSDKCFFSFYVEK